LGINIVNLFHQLLQILVFLFLPNTNARQSSQCFRPQSLEREFVPILNRGGVFLIALLNANHFVEGVVSCQSNFSHHSHLMNKVTKTALCLRLHHAANQWISRNQRICEQYTIALQYCWLQLFQFIHQFCLEHIDHPYYSQSEQFFFSDCLNLFVNLFVHKIRQRCFS
jgi:hypothetical protein